MSLNPDDPRPASQLIADDLRAQIVAGKLGAGQRLPSIRELATKHNVAQMTAQNAINLLRMEGLVMSSPGRGTFVRAEAVEVLTQGGEPSWEFKAITSRLDDMAALIVSLTERVAELEAITKSPDEKPSP